MEKRYRDIKTLPGGDIGFTYTPVKANENWFNFLLIISFLLLALIGHTYSYVNNPLYFLLILLPTSLLIYSFVTSNKEKENLKIELSAIEEIFNNNKLKEIAKDIYNADVEILYRKHLISQTSQFGHYERFYYVVYSNRKILRFKIVSRKGKDSDYWNLTIRIKPEECNYDEYACYVVPFIKRIQNRLSTNTPFVAVGLLFFFLIILSALLLLPFIYFTKVTSIIYFLWSFLLIVLLIINKWIGVPNWLYVITTFPGQLINLWIKLMAIFSAPLLGLLIILLLGGFFAILLYLAIVYFFLDKICWKPELAVFVGVSTISILSVHFIEISRWVIEKCGIFGVRETKTLELPILGLTEYILQKENLNAIIYLSYFIFLFYASIRLYVLPSPDSPIWDVGIDSAVTKAFVVHIAATNMIAKIKDKKIKIPKIYDYMKEILGLK